MTKPKITITHLKPTNPVPVDKMDTIDFSKTSTPTQSALPFSTGTANSKLIKNTNNVIDTAFLSDKILTAPKFNSVTINNPINNWQAADKLVGKNVGDNQSAVGNSSSGSSAAASPADRANLAELLQTQPNPLNDFANYTYHLRWFITNESDAYSIGKSKNPGPITCDDIQKIVIAESGVTGNFNITEFTINTACAPSAEASNMLPLTWSMTVTEAYGISLVDRIRTSAEALDIINFQKSPYFIEIWFNGYDNDGIPIATGITGSQKSFYRLWRVVITEMTSKTTEVGSTYTISGAIDNDLAFTNQNATSAAALNIKAKTFGEFLDQLTHQLNVHEVDASDNDVTTVQYVINAPAGDATGIRDWVLHGEKPAENSQRKAPFDVKDTSGTTEITITKGQDIGNIINWVASLSPDANQWLVGRTVDGKTINNVPNIVDHGLIRFFVLHGQTEIVGWDSYTGDYIKKITYTLVPYTTVKADLDHPTTVALQQKDLQQQKVAKLINNKKVSKVYEYIYTGRNTEIISFDISVKNFWTVAVQTFAGQNFYGQQTQGPKVARSSVAYETGKGFNSLQGQQLRAQLSADAKKVDELQNKKERTAEDNKALKQAQDVYSADQATLANVQVKEHQNSNFFFDQANRQGELQHLLSGLSATNAAKVNKAIHHYTTREQSIVTTYAEDQALYSPVPFPVVVVPQKKPSVANAEQSTDSSKTVSNARDDRNLPLPPSRGLFGTVLGNVRDASSEFIEIELEIRGDPYWLGAGHLEENKIILANAGAITKDQLPNSNTALYHTGDEMMLLTFRTGQPPDNDTGIMDLNGGTSSSFNGLYRVLNVTHHFKMGQFTQTLHASKDVYTQVVDQDLAAKTTVKNYLNVTPPPTAEATNK